VTRIQIGAADQSHLDDIVALQLELGEHHRELEPENPRYLIPEEDWRAQIEAALTEGRSRFFVATLNGKVCGFVRVTMVEKPWGSSCEMDTLVVADRARGHGIGSLLVDAAEQEARSVGARAMRANVLVSNLRGREFYETSGYAEIAVRFGKPL
jgi:ribosomal protein S18 acetylase RimI-like enzyme